MYIPCHHHHTCSASCTSEVFAPVAGRKTPPVHKLQQGSSPSDAAINTTCIKLNGLPLHKFVDCCIGHSNGTHAGPDLISSGGGRSCMLWVQLTGPDLLQLTLVFILSATGAITLLALRWWVHGDSCVYIGGGGGCNMWWDNFCSFKQILLSSPDVTFHGGVSVHPTTCRCQTCPAPRVLTLLQSPNLRLCVTVRIQMSLQKRNPMVGLQHSQDCFFSYFTSS